MRTQQIFLIISFSIICAGDPVYLAEIKNIKSEEVKIRVGFDREQLEKTWGTDKSYINFLKLYPNWTNIPPAIDFDTVNLIKTFRLESGKSFPLSSGIGGYPDLSLIKFLMILDKDSTLIENKEQLEDAFNLKEGRHWIMEIK